jgi:hypothetical protein
MTLDEVRKLLNENATVSLWPQAGQALGLTRGQTYNCANNGDIETLDFGKLKRVATPWLRKKLGLDGQAT